ncbi:Aerobic respiration control sensor protein ArcB [Rubripirellula lacrimiformis]|uniref:histidine kinase n=1 Tax=Rubripirellula lacrimiformis TaxID=1930273 RepID=A0A517NCC3_9BACT|nr:ATP-binding protein [Rubripirellula lacrimiformis]QDT04761.1 Aerobic respiration control sensor protein ArcB [Rubripirellula lacrimiformis]
MAKLPTQDHSDGATVAGLDALNQRVVALTPTPQDARLCHQVLVQNGIAVCCCDSIAAFTDAITEGAGIALIAQEHLGEVAIAGLKQVLVHQPKWSELPVLVLLQAGEVGSSTLQRILSLGHVTLINRPLRISIFVSTVLAKLRDRSRQFEVRDLLQEKDRVQQSLRQSSETFRRLIDDSPQGLYVVDSEMRMRYASKGAREAFCNVEPLIGRSLNESLRVIWSAEVADEVTRQFHHTMETGEAYTSPTFVHQRADKDVTEAYDWSLERIVLPGDRYGVVCHFYDNTQRQLSVEMLRQSEKYFREIADASPAMLWVTDENHRCTFLSKSWYVTTGQTEADGMGLGWTNATHPDDQQRAAEEFLAAATARQPFASEFRLRLADGDYRWAVDVGRARFADDGTFLGYTGYVIDVDERKAFEQSLERAKHIAETANRSRGEFLANMSHEIRTPMAAIMGHADILKDHIRDPDNLQVVETIRRNGDFLLNIINDILDLSKIDAGKMEIEKDRVRPDGILAEVRSLMDVRAFEKKIALQIEFDGPIPEWIETDAVRLRQILLNLVGNAIKFTDQGKVKVVCRYADDASKHGRVQGVDSATVDKRVPGRQRRTGRMVFHVIDTGIGIKPQDQQLLFQPFQQADNTSTRSFGGTGLGLAICRRLAQALGGEVSLESEFGHGSTFTLSIDTVAKGSLVEPNLSVKVSEDKPTESATISGNILVVDDRRDIRYLAQHFIEKAGGRVLTATNGQEAVDTIESDDRPQIDLIVMDMQMPVMDGYSAAAELRRRGCDLPIIALTANAMKSDRDECLAAGCTDYTTKPLDSQKLIAMIHRLTAGPSSNGPSSNGPS